MIGALRCVYARMQEEMWETIKFDLGNSEDIFRMVS